MSLHEARHALLSLDFKLANKGVALAFVEHKFLPDLPEVMANLVLLPAERQPKFAVLPINRFAKELRLHKRSGWKCWRARTHPLQNKTRGTLQRCRRGGS